MHALWQMNFNFAEAVLAICLVIIILPEYTGNKTWTLNTTSLWGMPALFTDISRGSISKQEGIPKEAAMKANQKVWFYSFGEIF